MSQEILNAIETFKAGLGDIQTGVAGLRADQQKHGEQLLQLQKEVNHLRKAQLARPRGALSAPVSNECAEWVASMGLVGAAQRGHLPHRGQERELLLGRAADVLGLQQKTAETVTQLPLPTVYQGEIVELVSKYGAARRFGTVFPLGAGAVSLPKLKTDTAFALVASSSGGGEKQPAFEFVSFAAEKYGGIVRVPAEIDADSVVPIGRWLANYCARQIAAIEDQLFFNNTANGTYGAPAGLCASVITNSKVTQMASTKTHYSDLTISHLRSVRGVVDPAAMMTGAYYCHPSFEGALAALNTSATVVPYQARGMEGPTLDGFPVRWVDIMPAYSTSANASAVCVLFGDLTYQYLGVRGGLRLDVSDLPYFAYDEIGFRCLERFTIGLMATGAVAGIETAAS